MSQDKMEGYRAIAFLIEDSARKDRNPRIGRIYPKTHHYMMKMTEERKGSS